MNYKCIVWCNFNKNSGTSGSNNGAKWKMTDTGVIDVEFDGFETNDTHYIAIVRGEVSGNGNECTVITNKTTKGFRVLNKKDINTMASYNYGTIAVFYDPTKVNKQEKVFPPKGTNLRNVTNGELFGDVTLSHNNYIWVGVPTSTSAGNIYIMNNSNTSQAMQITTTYLNRLQTIESDDYTWYKCSPSMFYDTNVTFNGIRFTGALTDVLVVFDESTNIPYVGTYDDAWKLADTNVFRFEQHNSQPLCSNGDFTSVTKDTKFVIGMSIATIENNQYPLIALRDFHTNTIIANLPDSEEAEKDFVHWDYNGVRYYEITPLVELPNGGTIGTMFYGNTNCGVYCWRDNSTNKAYIKGIKQ